MRREIFRDVPAPGEPLAEALDPQNQQLIAAELERRRQLASARLSRGEIRRLRKRSAVLQRQLAAGRYRDLVAERNALWQQAVRLRHELRSCCDRLRPLVETQLRKVIKKGRAVEDQIAKFSPGASELKRIQDRLAAHEQLIQFEREDRENLMAFRREAITWLRLMQAVFQRTERCRHRWQDESGAWHTDIPEIQRIYVKDDRLYYLVRTAGQTLLEKMLGRWHSALPDNVDVTDLVSDETLANLSASTRRRVTVEWSRNGSAFFYVIHRLDSPDGIPSRVLYAHVLDWYPEDEHHKTPWFAGVSEDRKVITFNFEDQPHVLIAGSTQSGKSNHINQMISTLVTMNSPDEVVLNLIDLKGGIEFVHWEHAAHLIMPVAKTPEQAIQSLAAIRGVMESRLQLFEKMRVKKLSQYNAKAEKPIPRIITVIDEMATLLGLGDTTTEYHNLLRVISSQGRAVGVHLILCTQHSSVDVLPGWIKTNMTLRASGRMPSVSASQVILDTITAATLPDVPGRMVFSIGRREMICQSPYISESEIARAVTISQQYSKPQPIDAAPPQPKPEFGCEDVIRLALEAYDGKLSASQMWRDGLKDSGLINWLRLNEVVNSIKRNQYVEFEGQTYDVKTTRGGGRQLVLSSNSVDTAEDSQNGLELGLELEVAT